MISLFFIKAGASLLLIVLAMSFTNSLLKLINEDNGFPDWYFIVLGVQVILSAIFLVLGAVLLIWGV